MYFLPCYRDNTVYILNIRQLASTSIRNDKTVRKPSPDIQSLSNGYETGMRAKFLFSAMRPTNNEGVSFENLKRQCVTRTEERGRIDCLPRVFGVYSTGRIYGVPRYYSGLQMA